MRETAPARIAGSALAFALVAVFIFDHSWNLFNSLRLKSFDLLTRQMPAPLADPPVVIVDIDQRSLAKHGQWPWPRSQTAELIRRIAEARPAVIGLDMVFAEPDRSSPGRLAETEWKQMHPAVRDYLRSLPDNDQVFAQTIAASPAPVVLGYAFSGSLPDTGGRGQEAAAAAAGPRPRSGSFALRGQEPLLDKEFTQVNANLDTLEQAAQGSGFVNIPADEDAIVRSLPLLLRFEGQLYPCIGLAMLQAAAGNETALVESNESGVRSIQVGRHRIPTTRSGEMLVHFSRQNRLRPHVSADEILSLPQKGTAGTEQERARAEILKARLEGAYVLIGTTSLFDTLAVPYDPAFPGVEFHAQVLNTVLSGDFLDRPDWVLGMEIVQTACIGLLLTLLLPQMRAATGVVLLAAVLSGNAAFALFWWNFWGHRLLVDMVMPTAAALLLFTVMTSVNHFTVEKKAQQLRSAFAQYLSPAVVEELVEKQDSLVLKGEERELTILFSDIRGFTGMAEKMQPEALCAFLNEYLTPMTAAVMDRRGTVDKFIGDAVMAFWNAPLATPDHARRACACALAMLEELKGLNQDWQARGLPGIHIGVGIHCGLARAGNMGSQQRFQYTVIGDTVNLASRLEGLTKLYGVDILVSGSVRKILGTEEFLFRQADTVRVVGKCEPAAIWQLLGRQDSDGWDAEELGLWDKAFALYSQGHFQAAGQILLELTGRQPEDKLYQVYVERCRQFIETPPQHWDGITNLRSK